MMAAMNEIMGGEATPAQIGAFITALRMKGETVEEVTGAARIMRQKATRVNACATTIVDTCGTGATNSTPLIFPQRRFCRGGGGDSSRQTRQSGGIERLRQRRRA